MKCPIGIKRSIVSTKKYDNYFLKILSFELTVDGMPI